MTALVRRSTRDAYHAGWGQDPVDARTAILEALPKVEPKVSDTPSRFGFPAVPRCE